MSNDLKEIAEGVKRIEEWQKVSQELLEHQCREAQQARHGLIDLLNEIREEMEEIRAQRLISDEKLKSMDKKVRSLDAKVTQLAALLDKMNCRPWYIRFIAWFVSGASIVGITLGCVWVMMQIKLETL